MTSPDVFALVALRDGKLTVHATVGDPLVVQGLLAQGAVSVMLTGVDGAMDPPPEPAPPPASEAERRRMLVATALEREAPPP